MTDFKKQYGQWAMIAGAAEGLGEAFCEILADKGMNLLMVDLKEKEMETLAKRLETRYGIKTRQILADLAKENSVEYCLTFIKEEHCRLLIYNAAYSKVKPFLSAEPEELELYINVNMRTPLGLVFYFTRHLKSISSPGGVLLMSSLAGIWGTKLVAAYSGTKAFNLALAEALHHELKPLNIMVSACCAGPVATPAYLNTKPEYGFIKPKIMSPLKVADYAIKHLGKKAVLIPGLSNRINYFMMTHLFPRKYASQVINTTMGKAFYK
jgi:short-subunit dehydrogenase